MCLTDTPERSPGAASLQVSGSLFNFYFYDGDCLNSCSIQGMAGKTFVWSESRSWEEPASDEPAVKVQHGALGFSPWVCKQFSEARP